MNGLKTEKYRYWLTYLLDDLPVGAAFTPSALHITIIPWFVVGPESEESLVESFSSTFSLFKKFTVTIGNNVSLGPREDVSVLLVENQPQIEKLHKAALEWFDVIEARWAVKNPYVGEEFIPHIRRREKTSLKKGDTLEFSSLSLIKALRRADDMRIVEAKVRWNG